MLLSGLCACATSPSVHDPDHTHALALSKADGTTVADGRGRFREIFCTVLRARSNGGAKGSSCEQSLVRLPDEQPGSARPVDLQPSRSAITVIFVPGLWSDCLDQLKDARAQTKDYLARFGYHFETARVSGISGSGTNARRIRDALAAMPGLGTTRRAVIVGHSKGVVDALEALVLYPELRPKVAAVISLAGAVGGSLLADRIPDVSLQVAAGLPGFECREGDMRALESLSPEVRKAWLARNPLPEEVRYYSIVALPAPDRVSTGLRVSYTMLSRIDPRNDGELLFYDQVVPQGTLLGYVNADHWAVAANLGASPYAMVRSLANQSAFPREQMLEAALRFVEEELYAQARR